MDSCRAGVIGSLTSGFRLTKYSRIVQSLAGKLFYKESNSYYVAGTPSSFY